MLLLFVFAILMFTFLYILKPLALIALYRTFSENNNIYLINQTKIYFFPTKKAPRFTGGL